VYAFFFAKAFEKTGLGERIANMMVAAVGHSTLGLSYSLAAAETLMSPAMPSCTARAGGIFMPVSEGVRG
jgi:DASS family divalent anion:Na+ symporter